MNHVGVPTQTYIEVQHMKKAPLKVVTTDDATHHIPNHPLFNRVGQRWQKSALDTYLMEVLHVKSNLIFNIGY